MNITVDGRGDSVAADGTWYGYTADQMRAYAADQVSAERERCAVALQMLGMAGAAAVIRARCTPQRAP